MNKQSMPNLDTVRSWIDQYGKQVTNLKDQKGQEIAIIRLREDIEQALAFYQAKGALVSPERTRLSNFDAELKKAAPLFLKMVGAKKLAEERKKLDVPPEKWWWWLDQIVKEKRQKRLKKTARNLVIISLVFLGLYFFVFRLPPDEQSYLNALTQAEAAISKQEFTQALSYCQQAIEIFPDRPVAYVITGCLHHKLGQEDEARLFFQKAEELYPHPHQFLLETANWYFRLQLLEEAKTALEKILNEDPQHLAALNLLGSIYETEEKIIEALELYQQVLELAEEQGEEALIPVTRMKIALLQMRLPTTTP